MTQVPGRGTIPPATFKNFVTELASTALVCLGYIQSPVSGQRTLDLARGAHVVDLLAMLQVKTHGNLNDEEREYLDTVVEDLQVKLAERKAPTSGAGPTDAGPTPNGGG